MEDCIVLNLSLKRHLSVAITIKISGSNCPVNEDIVEIEQNKEMSSEIWHKSKIQSRLKDDYL